MEGDGGLDGLDWDNIGVFQADTHSTTETWNLTV